MKPYIPRGMMQKELNWERTNLHLYEWLIEESFQPEINQLMSEMKGIQEKQLPLLNNINTYLNRVVDEGVTYYEHYDSYIEGVEELYAREYQLLQEYISLYSYFLRGHSLQAELLPLVQLQQQQVNTLQKVKDILPKLSTDQDSKSSTQPFHLESGYILEKVKGGLDFPTSICFDESGVIYIAESGFVYGKPPGEGRILRLENNSEIIEVASGFNGPLTGMIYEGGVFYVSVGNRSGKGEEPCGSIIRVFPNGVKEEIITGLRTCGDHFTGDLVISPDQKLYFGVGTGTNSGVVGKDLSGKRKRIQQGHGIVLVNKNQSELFLANVIRAVQGELNGNTILLTDVGANKMEIARVFQPTNPNHVLISNGFASMGIALPGAIAAKLACPEQPVVCITGDGGFLMNLAELETAKRLTTPMIILVLNDEMYGLEKKMMIEKQTSDDGVYFTNPNFVQLAESFGIKGYRVENTDMLKNILKQELTSNNIVLIEVPIQYE
jgi:hypothetical protein